MFTFLKVQCYSITIWFVRPSVRLFDCHICLIYGYRIRGYCEKFSHTLIKCFSQLANITIPPKHYHEGTYLQLRNISVFYIQLYSRSKGQGKKKQEKLGKLGIFLTLRWDQTLQGLLKYYLTHNLNRWWKVIYEFTSG